MEHPFERVVRDELPALLRYATALCGEPEQARDLVQEVLARAYARWDRIGTADRPAAYLMRMVTNEFVSWRRRWSTRSIIASDAGVFERADPDGTDHGETLAVREDLEQRLRRLPRRQQAALVLHFLEGLDYAHAAQVLGCAEGTVRSACSRGLATLRLDRERERLEVSS